MVCQVFLTLPQNEFQCIQISLKLPDYEIGTSVVVFQQVVTNYMPEPSTGTNRVFQEQDTYFYNSINNPNTSSEDLSAFLEHWELNGVTAEQEYL